MFDLVQTLKEPHVAINGAISRNGVPRRTGVDRRTTAIKAAGLTYLPPRNPAEAGDTEGRGQSPCPLDSIAPLLALPARPILDVDQVIAGPSAPQVKTRPANG